jgi:Raf kinase inhibitor-like YbhB/YbcL family protein
LANPELGEVRRRIKHDDWDHISTHKTEVLKLPSIVDSKEGVTELRLWSDDFTEGQSIPDHCALENENTSPHLAWEGVPAGTRSFALVCIDPDARKKGRLHWLVHGIPFEVREVSSGAPVPGTEVENDFEKAAWCGPAPRSGTHRYIFTLYALGVPSLEGARKTNFKKLCEKHNIGSAETIGVYSKR